MKTCHSVIGVLLALLFASSQALAADEPAFTGTGTTCADITWQPSALARFPNIATVCQGVVENNGKYYARFDGVVQKAFGTTLYILFKGGENVPGGDRAVRIQPPADMKIKAGKREIRLRDALPSQEFAVYIPSDHFIVNLGEEIAVAEQTEIIEVIPVAEVPVTEPPPAPPPSQPAQVAEATPAPAPAAEEPPPAMSPPEEPAVTPAPTPAPMPATPPKKEESPWLLILGIVIVIIVIAVLVRRGRKAK